MLKFFSFFSLMLILNIQSQAQSSIGPTAGLSIAKLYNLENADGITSSYKVGLSIGVAFETVINAQFSFQPELRFTQMGDLEKFDMLADVSTNLNYISLPLFAKYKFGSNQTKFFILAGPRIGYGIGDITGKSDEDSESMSYEDAQIKRFDFGLEFGVGVSFQLGTGSIFIDARYYLGLQKLATEQRGDNAKNTAIGINVGYLFALGN